jgi:hypothetical protein
MKPQMTINKGLIKQKAEGRGQRAEGSKGKD